MNFRSMWKSAHPICFSRNNYTERAAQNSVGSQALPTAYMPERRPKGLSKPQAGLTSPAMCPNAGHSSTTMQT